MAFGDSLPVAESIGVFLGVTGVDWLADGHAELGRAVILALAAGTVIFLAREVRRRKKD